MTVYRSFEGLPVWKSSKELAVLIYRITGNSSFRKDKSFLEQIRRSVISISSNIAEGFDRSTKQEFLQFLYYSRGSCGELRSQLIIAHDIGYLNDDEYEEFKIKCEDVSKQISGLIKYLKSNV